MEPQSVVSLLIQGYLLGLSVAAPIGPINILCIHRTLGQGPRYGIATAVGCAGADGTYAALAAFGITAVSGFLVENALVFRLAGAAILAWLGIRALRRGATVGAVAESDARALLGGAASAYALTIANPMTIILFAGLIAGVGLKAIAEGGASASALIVAGVFCGTFSWMSGLVLVSGLMRARVGDKLLARANQLGALILFGFAFWLAASAIIG